MCSLELPLCERNPTQAKHLLSDAQQDGAEGDKEGPFNEGGGCLKDFVNGLGKPWARDHVAPAERAP